MKEIIGKCLYAFLMLFVGIILIYGAYYNFKQQSGYVVVVGSLMIGIGIFYFSIKEFIKIKNAYFEVKDFKK